MEQTLIRSYRNLFTIVVLTLSILVNLPALAQLPASQRDLSSILEAKVLRVVVTRFDLPSFHVRGPDGALLGPEIEMATQIGHALGVKVEFVDNAVSFDAVVDRATVVEAPNWNAAIQNLLSRRVDAVYRDEFEIRRVLKNKPALNVPWARQ